MKQKFHSFAGRLTRRVIVMMLIVMTFTSGLVFLFAAGSILSMMTDHYQDILSLTSERTEGMLRLVEVSSANNVDEISKHLAYPDQVLQSLESELRLNPHIVGCAVAFEQNYYPQKGLWYEPYARWTADGSIEMLQIGGPDHDYFMREWYLKGITSETGYWSEPYYDEAGARTMLCSYVLPVKDKKGDVAGVFGADVSLSWLTEQVKNLDLNAVKGGIVSLAASDTDHAAYAFILSRNGDYLVHPDPNRILSDNFFKHDGDERYQKVGRAMLAGESGRGVAEVDGVRTYVFYAPLMHSGWSMAIVIPVENIMAPGLYLGLLIISLLVLGLLVAFILFRSAIRRTARPLKFLVRSTEEVAKGHFDTPLPQLRFYDEIHQLRDSFEHMQHSLTSYVNELTEVTTREAAIDRELDIARNIQMSMLPTQEPLGRKEIDIFGTLTPAKAVGGDLYDYFVRDNQLYFCIGDVSGKGVPAAMVMAVTSALFRSLSDGESSPSQVVNGLNANLSTRNESLMFVTLFFGILDLSSGQLRYCNAGHDAPLLIGPDGSVEMLEVESNLAVGVMPGWEFVEQEVKLKPGSLLFLYTDGLTEAENPVHDLFGMDRILEEARKGSQQQPANFVASMEKAVHIFVDGAEPSDDLTMLAIRYVC